MRSLRWLIILALLLVGAPQRPLADPAPTGAPVVVEPPKGWDPLRATPEELQRYNFPPRPTEREALERWTELVAKSRWHRPSFAGGRVPTKAGASPAKGQEQEGPSHMSTLNWGGLVSRGTYTAVSGRWRQPFAYAQPGKRMALATQWVGLGGHSPGVPLIQAGTESRVFPDNSGSYDAWYEIVGTSADTAGARRVDFPHVQGNEIYVQVWWTEEKGVGTAHFYLADTTLGSATSFSVPKITNYEGVTGSAEWINELPTLKHGTAYLTLPYYSQAEKERVSFTDSRAGSIDDLRHPDPYARSTVYIDTYRESLLIQGVTPVDANGGFETLWFAY